MTGVIMTTVKLNSPFEQVETTFASARVRMGDSSAGYNQGRGSMAATKKAMYKKGPKTAPLAGGGTSATGEEAGEDNYHRNHLASHTADEELATADLLDEEPGEGGEDGVVDHVDTADEHGHELSLAEGLLKKDGRYYITALQPDSCCTICEEELMSLRCRCWVRLPVSRSE